MHGLLEANSGKISMDEVKYSMGGNMCRCTGYRPILKAFKSMAFDATQCVDIEDLNEKCTITGDLCTRVCNRSTKCLESFKISFKDGKEWSKVKTIEAIFDVLTKCGKKSYILVAGNTAHGVYRRNDEDLQVYIDINDVEELHSYKMGKEIVIGANTTLTNTMDIFQKAVKMPGFEYCETMRKHIDLVANVPVRNVS